MNAIIFAAGLGTRLKPLTNDRPKALVEVNGKSLLEHNILKLKKDGFEHIVVNVHHFGKQIIDFIADKKCFGIDIKISDEQDLLLDTGGGIRKALKLFDNDDPVLVHNVDIISTIDLHSIYQNHKDSKAEATLCVAQRDTSRYLLFNEEMRLRGWTNINTGEVKGEKAINQLAFSGIHIINKSLCIKLEEYPQEVFPIMDFYLSTASSCNYQGLVLPEDTKWVDCGKQESLKKASVILDSLC